MSDTSNLPARPASTPTRESLLANTFVALADTLVAGYDVVDLLHTLVERCASILDAVDAGIMLDNGSGELGVIASTSERSHLIELMQLRSGEGPCLEAFHTGRVVSVADVGSTRERWPEFSERALALGYASVHSIPLRLRAETIGSLNVFGTEIGEFSAEDVVVAQALADVATIGILQERAFRESDLSRQQLQRALDSRVTIEQAKGFIAQTHGLDTEEAFTLIRTHARANGLRLDDVARSIVDRSLDL